MRANRENFTRGSWVKEVRQFPYRLIFWETFTNWIDSIWGALVSTTQYSENFTDFHEATWTALTLTQEFFDDFETGW